MNQFAMVEELASLVKDNLSCKHLVLSVEESLIDFLQNDTSDDGTLELEPMNPYSRLLLHRLADIFGFSHVSVGEGEDRHLILERCPESSIPPILVSDILMEYDEYQSPSASHQILRRKEALPASMTNTESPISSLEEREAAYLAARERIFSVDKGEIKESVMPKPRNVPVVARRMIAHALGQSIHSNSPCKVGVPKVQIKELKTWVKSENHLQASTGVAQEITSTPTQKASLDRRTMPRSSEGGSHTPRKTEKNPMNNRSTNGGAMQSGNFQRVVCEDSLKRENAGAAKRLFAHALGLQGSKGGAGGHMLKCNAVKANGKE